MSNGLPDLNSLVVFLAAAECNNFSQAGRQLHLSQPAVSQTIDGLERHFGVELFERQGRSVRLTEAGQALKPMALELVAAARRMEECLASLQGEVIGELELGCSTASGKYLLPGLVARFRRSFPQVRINIQVTSREMVLNRLLSGEYSFGVSSRRVVHRDLEYMDFFQDSVILVVAKDHPWARNRQVYPDDLLDQPMILREENAGTLEVLYEALHAHDISPDMLNVAMTLGNAEAIAMAVEEGIGIAFISRLAAATYLDLGRLVEVKVEGVELKRDIYLARSRRFPATRAQAAFWEFVQSPQVELATVV